MLASPLALDKHLRRLKDPRINRCKRHVLVDIITMAVCAVIGNANTWPEVAAFARRRRDWFARFLELPNGIPSQHTFRRLFERLDPHALQHALLAWVQQLSATLGVRHIAVDGKTLRHSKGGASVDRSLHLVSAWATEANLTLGQVAVAEESNEITAIPRLLELLDLHGAWVTIDAIGCQKEIAQKIVDGGGDYVLTVKDNQGHLLQDILDSFIKVYDNNGRGGGYAKYETEEDGHGRHEKRVYEILTDTAGVRDRELWPKLTVLGKCYSERTHNGETSCEARYFIGSRRCSAKHYGALLRNHWRIENCLHWQMDVTFGEDASRIRQRHGGQNFALLRRLALSVLKQHPSTASIRCKRYEAALDVTFLEEVLTKPLNLSKLK